jgi:hypothetical protein
VPRAALLALLVTTSVAARPAAVAAQVDHSCVDYCVADATAALRVLLCAVQSDTCVCNAGAGSVTGGARARPAGNLNGTANGTVAEDTSSILPKSGQITPQRASNQEAPPSAVEDDGTLQVGAPFDFVVNDNGTISDCVTNLLWEKKSRDDGLHEVNDTYAWSEVLELTIWDFIDALNGSCAVAPNAPCSTNDDCATYQPEPGSACLGGECTDVPPTTCVTNADCKIRENGSTCDERTCSGSPLTITCTTNADCTDYDAGVCGYAGFQDWRIPNVKELLNLIDYGANGPNMQPAFDTDCTNGCSIDECSCTAQLFHWSSTTFDDTVTSAWAVGYDFGDARGREKSGLRAVRAVRGPADLSALSGCESVGPTTTVTTTTSLTTSTTIPASLCGTNELDLCATPPAPSASDALEVLKCAVGSCPDSRGCSGASSSIVVPQAGTTGPSSTTSSTTTTIPTRPSGDCGDERAARLPVSGQTQSFTADKFETSNQVVDDNGVLQCGRQQTFTVRTDGTILDHLTCLIWEKKTDDDNVLHDKDLTFTWSGGGQLTIWDWIFRINNRCELNANFECGEAGNIVECSSVTTGDGRPGGACGFGGKCDWRIPNVKELQSIINFGRSNPNVDTNSFNTECSGCALSDEECSCVESMFHWSGTSFDQRAGGSAWAVGFGFGDVRGRDKTTLYAVRAVRGPLERDADGDCIDDSSTPTQRDENGACAEN